MNFTFAALAEKDLAQLHDWLNRPHVSVWWGKNGSTREQVDEKYKPRIAGKIPCSGFRICSEEKAIGYIQSYWLKDFPDYASQIFNPDEEEELQSAAGFDIFIGEEAYVNKGYGQNILRSFLRERIFGTMQAAVCMVGPAIENNAAIRVYEKVGFTYWKTVEVTDSGTEYILKLRRIDFA